FFFGGDTTNTLTHNYQGVRLVGQLDNARTNTLLVDSNGITGTKFIGNGIGLTNLTGDVMFFTNSISASKAYTNSTAGQYTTFQPYLLCVANDTGTKLIAGKLTKLDAWITGDLKAGTGGVYSMSSCPTNVILNLEQVFSTTDWSMVPEGG